MRRTQASLPYALVLVVIAGAPRAVVGEGSEAPDGSVAISAIPFADTGDTRDNVDDLPGLICLYADLDAPDVYYAYTPTRDETITVSLCGRTFYDTNIWVLDDALDLVACNEDGCVASTGELFVSEIPTVPLVGGRTYHIRIHGWSSGAGWYEVIVRPVDCDGNGVDDEIDLADGGADCNQNGVLDPCEIASGMSGDADRNGVPDECDVDCDGNGVPDVADFRNCDADDFDLNGLPDGCVWPGFDVLSARDSGRFGASIAMVGNIAVVGAPDEDDGEGLSGVAYVHARDPVSGTWHEVQRLAPDLLFGDRYGSGVAARDDLLVVGSRGFLEPGRTTVYGHDGDAWTALQELTPPGLDDGDRFGVAISIDGGVIAVGAPGDSDLVAAGGTVQVFREDVVGAWTHEQKLVPSDLGLAARLGTAVALDGDVIVAGAPEDDELAEDAGAAYVFEWDGTAWVERAKLFPSDAGVDRRFGIAVAIAGDTIIVGAPSVSSGPGFTECSFGLICSPGAAFVFRRDAFGDWSEEAMLVPSDGAVLDAFGAAVSLVGDEVLIGAPGAAACAPGGPCGSGKVYRFDRAGVVWTETGAIGLPGAPSGSALGASVAFDGVSALVGLPDYACRGGAVLGFRDVSACRGDLDGSGDVGFADLARLLASWGDCLPCAEDLDGDGTVGFTDLTMLLGSWGPCP